MCIGQPAQIECDKLAHYSRSVDHLHKTTFPLSGFTCKRTKYDYDQRDKEGFDNERSGG